MQALRRRSQSLPVKPLDSEHRFIDDLTPNWPTADELSGVE